MVCCDLFQAESSVGMAMVFTLVDSACQWMNSTWTPAETTQVTAMIITVFIPKGAQCECRLGRNTPEGVLAKVNCSVLIVIAIVIDFMMLIFG